MRLLAIFLFTLSSYISVSKYNTAHESFLQKEKPNLFLNKEFKDISISDRQIRNFLIFESIKNYLGSCPCPYFSDRVGRRCGGRSAWSRPGGYSPLCYESDVSEKW